MQKLSSRSLFGGGLVAVGGLLLLDALNLVDVSGLVNNWGSLLVIAVGLISLVSNPRAFVMPVAITLVGVLLLLNSLGVINVNIWQLIVPIAIIGFGLSILMKRSRSGGTTVTDEEIKATVLFSGLELHNTTDHFKGGAITALFGGAEIDLRHAKLQGETTIDLFVAFGGVELRVPEEWDIHFSGIPIFGGIEDGSRKPQAENPPRLNLKGTCLFGGVEIKN